MRTDNHLTDRLAVTPGGRSAEPASRDFTSSGAPSATRAHDPTPGPPEVPPGHPPEEPAPASPPEFPPDAPQEIPDDPPQEIPGDTPPEMSDRRPGGEPERPALLHGDRPRPGVTAVQLRFSG